MGIKQIWSKSYVKAIIMCIGFIVSFGSGLWTGCSDSGETKRKLNESIVYNEEMEARYRKLENINRGLEQANTKLTEDKRHLQSTNKELESAYNGIRNAYIGLQEGIIKSEQYNTEAERIIKDSLKLIEKENN